MARTGESVHVRPDLGHHLFGGSAPHPRNGVKRLEGCCEWGHPPLDLRTQSPDPTLELLDVLELLAQPEALMLAEASVEGAFQGGALRLQPPLGQRSQRLWIVTTGDDLLQHLPSRLPQHIGGDRRQLDVRPFEHLLDTERFARPLLDHRPPVGSAPARAVPVAGGPG